MKKYQVAISDNTGKEVSFGLNGIHSLIESFVKQASIKEIVQLLPDLDQLGYDINTILSMDSFEGFSAEDVSLLMKVGADLHTMLYGKGYMKRSIELDDNSIMAIVSCNYTINGIIDELNTKNIVRNFVPLIEAGANQDEVLEEISFEILDNFGDLYRKGVDINALILHLRSYELDWIVKDPVTFLRFGADPTTLALAVLSYWGNTPDKARQLLYDLAERGARLQQVFDKAIDKGKFYFIAKYIPIFEYYGVNVDYDYIVQNLKPDEIAKSIDTLEYVGVKIDTDKLLAEISYDTLVECQKNLEYSTKVKITKKMLKKKKKKESIKKIAP